MKKVVVLLFIMVFINILCFNNNDVIIPSNSIRFRIIANSDSDYDQTIKLKIKDEIENKLKNLLRNAKSIEEYRDIINNNINEIENITNKYNVKYSISYGENYFPLKKYKGVVYNEGYYESLVITLGEGLGHNWWCVLFPPLCFLDENTSDDIEYDFLVKNIINNYK